MNRRRFLLLSAVVILVAGISGGLYYALGRPTKVTPQVTETKPTSPVKPIVKKERPNIDELFALTNEERAKVGSKALQLSSLLNKSAQMKADEMERTGVYSHINPETGRHGWQYIDDVNQKCIDTAENLVDEADISDSRDEIAAWMASTQGHRETLLNPKWELVGFGISEHYVVQHFCNLR